MVYSRSINQIGAPLKQTLTALYKLTQFNEHIYFVIVTSLLGLAASKGQFDWRFFILLPANVLVVSFIHMLSYIIDAPGDALSNNIKNPNPISTGLITPGAAKKFTAFIGLLSAILYAILGTKPLLFGMICLSLGFIYSIRRIQHHQAGVFDISSQCLVFAGFQYLCSYFTYTSGFNRVWFWPFALVISLSFFREDCINPGNLHKTQKSHNQSALQNPGNRFNQIIMIFAVSVSILSTIATFLIINIIPNWTLILVLGLSIIFIIPSLFNVEKGETNQILVKKFQKPLEQAAALSLFLGELLPWLDKIIGTGIFS